ncbi:MAG: DUF2252 domain-containing protein [Candidatus Nanopelagicales bacterium]
MPTVTQRQARGEQARTEVPLADLGEYSPASGRADPVALLESQSETRVPGLVPVRYGRMLASPFTFFRGAALIMASDLSRLPHSDLEAQLCGDAHLSNFGAFASPERHLVFDINDFDETHPGPFEWDVKRLVTSMEVAARDRGFRKKERADIVLRCAQSYRETVASLATMGRLDVWYSTLDVDQAIGQLMPMLKAKDAKRSRASLAKARTRTSLQAADKLTRIVDGARQFVDDPPIIERFATIVDVDHLDGAALAESFARSWQQYTDSLQPDRRHLLSGYSFVDLAFKVVGVGSVGTRAWAVLCQGRDPSDLLMLQVKEAQASVLEAFTRPSAYSQHGERVVQGQRLLQSASDIFLGWAHFEFEAESSTDYYVRQLRDWKASADVAAMSASALSLYGTMCAGVLAKGHARSGDRVALAAYLDQGADFDEAMARFARAYADQNEDDYRAFSGAAASGRITATTDI